MSIVIGIFSSLYFIAMAAIALYLVCKSTGFYTLRYLKKRSRKSQQQAAAPLYLAKEKVSEAE